MPRPANPAAMTPDRLRACLRALDWTQRGVARQLCRPENAVRQWASGAARVPEDVARWLEAWARHAERHPPPVRAQVARVATGAEAADGEGCGDA